jgi:uncharacterized membrane protein YczE
MEHIMVLKDKVLGFVWQHVLLLFSLYVMTLGVAVCVRSAVGSSVISTLPYVFQQAGSQGIHVPQWSIGVYTIVANFIFVLVQMIILRKQFEWVQLFQLVIGAFFGSLIDVNMLLTSWLVPTVLWSKLLAQWVGCTILGLGIALEVRCGSVTMPGEGMPIAISRVTGVEFPKVKIMVDVTLVVLAVVFSYIFFGTWQWHITGVGTLFAMVYVGIVVRIVAKHLGWFDSVLNYRPGFRRYIYGLARYIKP